MAVGRVVVTQCDVVLPGDTAIAEDADYEAYADSLFDRSKLSMRNGEAPTLFRIRPLSFVQRRHMSTIGDADKVEQCVFAIRCGLMSVTGYLLQNPDGSTGEALPAPSRKRVADLGELIEDAWMERAAFTSAQLGALAGSILRISEVPLRPC